MSIQELWCNKLKRKNGGLGYKYRKHMIGGALTEDTWDPSVYDGDESVYSLVNDASTVTGFNPYAIGRDQYEEYTPAQEAYFTRMRNLKETYPREIYEINRYGEAEAKKRKEKRVISMVCT